MHVVSFPSNIYMNIWRRRFIISLHKRIYDYEIFGEELMSMSRFRFH